MICRRNCVFHLEHQLVFSFLFLQSFLVIWDKEYFITRNIWDRGSNHYSQNFYLFPLRYYLGTFVDSRGEEAMRKEVVKCPGQTETEQGEQVVWTTNELFSRIFSRVGLFLTVLLEVYLIWILYLKICTQWPFKNFTQMWLQLDNFKTAVIIKPWELKNTNFFTNLLYKKPPEYLISHILTFIIHKKHRNERPFSGDLGMRVPWIQVVYIFLTVFSRLAQKTPCCLITIWKVMFSFPTKLLWKMSLFYLALWYINS